jgi:hypothetical protein
MQRNDAENRNSYWVSAGWLAIAAAIFGLVVLRASDDQPPGCQGYCWSERDGLLTLGIFYGSLFLLIGMVTVPLVTRALTERDWSPFEAGTVAFFTTAVVPGGVFAYTR